MGRSSARQASSKDFTSIVPPPASKIDDFRLPIDNGGVRHSAFSIGNRQSSIVNHQSSIGNESSGFGCNPQPAKG
jgi:hypothetical protein